MRMPRGIQACLPSDAVLLVSLQQVPAPSFAPSARLAGLTGRSAVGALNPEERARRARRKQRFAALQASAGAAPVQVCEMPLWLLLGVCQHGSPCATACEEFMLHQIKVSVQACITLTP